MIDKRSCPDPNVLARFAEGQLQGEERASLINHVNGCDQCLELVTEWMEFQANDGKDMAAELVSFRQRKRPVSLWSSLAVAVLLILSFGWFLGRDDTVWQQPQWWLATYGPANTDATTQRARAVFERMLVTMDDTTQPQLYLIGETKAPMVLALEDAVVVSREALAMVYQGVSTEHGDARLALVLGHELTHLQHGETNHAFAAYERFQNQAEPDNPLGQQTETRADQWGLVYAAMAGFDPQMILEDSETFLSQWCTLGIADSSSHPDALSRARVLAEELESVARDLDDFYYGMRFYQANQYEQAIDLLERFSKRYQGREVFNNLGLAELGLALRALGDCDGALLTRFKLPFLLDNQTLAEASTIRGGYQDSECYQRAVFQGHHQRSLAHFQRALALEPSYQPALQNQISAHLLAGEAAAALTLTPNLIDSDMAHSLEALSIYLFGLGTDTEKADRGEALAILEALPVEPTALYNRAAILAESGGDARVTLAAFLVLEPYGAFADRARELLGKRDGGASNEAKIATPLEIPVGPITPATEERLSVMASRRLERAEGRTWTIYQDESFQILREEDWVLIVEQALSPAIPLSSLSEPWQSGQSVKATSGDVLVGAGWMIETRADRALTRIRFRHR